ncbi:hypothetical protein I552_6639 [Mycobacterium xenopi 3993]|nr:hypothetical protein I552_6639 [Mycobacterium xenopi 3993]
MAGVPTTAMFAFGVVGYFIDKEKPWIAAAGGAVIVLAAIGLGHGDASWGYRLPAAARAVRHYFDHYPGCVHRFVPYRISGGKPLAVAS